jgi:hypothetical protein
VEFPSRCGSRAAIDFSRGTRGASRVVSEMLVELERHGMDSVLRYSTKLDD